MGLGRAGLARLFVALERSDSSTGMKGQTDTMTARLSAPHILTVAVVGAITAGLMAVAAAYGAKFTSLGAALGFAILAIDVSLRSNREIWKDAAGALKENPDAAFLASQVNGRLMSGVYMWGALALLLIYSTTELWWFHSWQYGLAMALIAAALMGYVYLLGDRESAFRSMRSLDISAALALAQAAGAAVALGFLISSGKLASLKADWPANHVFLAGGLAIIPLSLAAAITHSRLKRAGAGQQ